MKKTFSEIGATIKANKDRIIYWTGVGLIVFGVSYISSYVGTMSGYANGYKAGARDTFDGLNTIAKTINEN